MKGLNEDVAGESTQWASETERRAAGQSAQEQAKKSAPRTRVAAAIPPGTETMTEERGYRLLLDAREVLCLDNPRKRLGLLILIGKHCSIPNPSVHYSIEKHDQHAHISEITAV